MSNHTVTTQATRRMLTIPASEMQVGDVFNLGEEAVTVTDHRRILGYERIQMLGRDESHCNVNFHVRAGLHFTVTREVTE